MTRTRSLEYSTDRLCVFVSVKVHFTVWSPLKLLDNISDADIQKDDGAAATKQATTMLGSLAAEMTNLFGAS